MSHFIRPALVIGALAIGLVGIAVAQEVQRGAWLGLTEEAPQQQIRAAAPEATARPAAASTANRYDTLLRTIDAPDDRASYGDFCNYGYWTGTSYAGHDDLPPGYWVYVAPKWYIFKQPGSAAVPTRSRPWGPEQATGAPDTWPNSGDVNTAWASKTPDGQPEWLELTYQSPVRPAAVLVYETYNPGAVNRVTGYDPDGKEVELWAGSDPTPAGKDKGISIIPIHPEFDLSKIRVYLDSPKVPGWNEIDAVGLLDAGGKTHWATSAIASSTYADVIGSDSPIDLSLRRPGTGGTDEADRLSATEKPVEDPKSDSSRPREFR